MSRLEGHQSKLSFYIFYKIYFEKNLEGSAFISDKARCHLSLSQTSPGFYVSAVEVF